jgi:hypothetical protein
VSDWTPHPPSPGYRGSLRFRFIWVRGSGLGVVSEGRIAVQKATRYPLDGEQTLLLAGGIRDDGRG